MQDDDEETGEKAEEDTKTQKCQAVIFTNPSYKC